MTALITLRQAKIQCRIEVTEDDTDDTGGEHPDNSYLMRLIKAAILAFQNSTNRILYPDEPLPDEAPNNALQMDALIQQGLLMLISHWYENRVIVGNVVAKIPYSFDFIAEPHRWFHL